MSPVQWPLSAARCVYCREWETYGYDELVEIERFVGLVYSHRGCAIRYPTLISIEAKRL